MLCSILWFNSSKGSRSKGGTVVRALASHHCNIALVHIPASMPYVVCGLSLLLVLSFVPRGFSPGTSVFPSPHIKPTFPKSNSTRNGRQRTNVIICYFYIVLYFIILFTYLNGLVLYVQYFPFILVL